MPQFDTSSFQSSITWLLIVLSTIYSFYKYYVIPNFLKNLNKRNEYIQSFIDKERKIQFQRRELFRKHQEIIQQTKKQCETDFLEMERKLTQKSKTKINDYHQQQIEKYQTKERIFKSQFESLEKSINSKGQEIAQELVEAFNQLSAQPLSAINHSYKE